MILHNNNIFSFSDIKHIRTKFAYLGNIPLPNNYHLYIPKIRRTLLHQNLADLL